MICLSYNQSPLDIKKPNLQVKIKELPSTYWSYGFQKKCIEWNQLHRMVNSDYRVYSAGIFEGGHRKNDNWKGSNIIILDVDNDGNEESMSLNKAKEFFSGMKCIITTTKSHQVGKNGLPPADRYRVVIALKNKILCTQKEYSNTMKMLLHNMFPFADKKCSDPARFYFGAYNSEYHYFDGEMFDFDRYASIEKEVQKAKTSIQKVKTEKYDGENIIEQFNSNTNIHHLLQRYGYVQKGKRYISPNSSSGMAGVVVFEDGDKDTVYSHHNSDGFETALDAFGLFATIEHNGNLSSAYRSLRETA